jgi:tRNA A-37 threonylcarbamoyl transferase component Bud32
MTRVPEGNDSSPATAAPEDCLRIRAGAIRWTVRPSFDKTQLAAILNNPDASLADASQHFKNSRNVTVARVTLNGPRPPRLVLRRLNYGRLRHRLRDTFRPSRAERAFRYGLRLEQAGVTTPRVVAAGARRVLRWPVQAYLLTEEVPGATPLNRFLAEQRRWPRSLVLKLADLIARLHERGFSHRDLKSTNVLLDARLDPYLIDLDGLRIFGAVSERRARADLVRLAREFKAHPRTLQWTGARFLQRYCQARRLERSFQPWARAIMARL